MEPLRRRLLPMPVSVMQIWPVCVGMDRLGMRVLVVVRQQGHLLMRVVMRPSAVCVHVRMCQCYMSVDMHVLLPEDHPRSRRHEHRRRQHEPAQPLPQER